MILHVFTIIFGVLHIMSVLAVARHAANAVAQICKMLSSPSKCVLICGCKCKGKGHYFMSRVWTHPVLCWVMWKLEVVPKWMGNLCFGVNPLQTGVVPVPKES